MPKYLSDMQTLVDEEKFTRALRLAQRHVRAACALASALDHPEHADDLRTAYGRLVMVADGELRRSKKRGTIVCR